MNIEKIDCKVNIVDRVLLFGIACFIAGLHKVDKIAEKINKVKKVLK